MAKRMNGEALIRKRPDGRYELRIMEGYQKNGKQKVVSFLTVKPSRKYGTRKRPTMPVANKASI